MAQDTHLSSIRRPRETLGSINFNSAIPQPHSALKRSSSINNVRDSQIQPPHTGHHARSVSSSRMSLAPSHRPQQPAFQRSSSGTNLADLGHPATVQQNSMSTGFSGFMSSQRMSYAPGSAVTPHMQPPMSVSQTLQRRSSVFSRPSTGGPMSHQSFFVQAPIPAGVPRDPRPLKDGAYRARIGQELLDYLTHNNFELEMKHSLGQNTLKSPTQKDFNLIFQWLYHRIDPAYKFQKSIDAEVPPILKQLRYPYEKSITKSQITAVGGQNWSTFLGMLHWIMQLAQMLDRYDLGTYDDACAEAGIDVSGDRIIYRFLTSAYRDWLQMDDDDEESDKLLLPHVQAMAAEFEHGNRQHLENVKILEAENAALKEQIEDAEKSTPDIAKLDRTFQVLAEDRSKFESYNAKMDDKAKKYEKMIEMLTKDIKDREAELQAAQLEKDSLQATVDKQGISVQDIDRMNSERNSLQKSLDLVASRVSEKKKALADREADTSAKLEALEREVSEYNSSCYRNGLIPASAPNADNHDFELQLLIHQPPAFSSSTTASSSLLSPSETLANEPRDRLLFDPTTGYHPSQILNLDIHSTIKPQLKILRKDISDRIDAVKDADEKIKSSLDESSDILNDKRDEVKDLENEVRVAEEECAKCKEVTKTKETESKTQIEQLDNQVKKLEASIGDSLQLMEERELIVNIEYKELALKAETQRKELRAEIEKMLNDICKFKLHVGQSLEKYEELVVKEVEVELGMGDEDEDEDGDGDEEKEDGVKVGG